MQQLQSNATIRMEPHTGMVRMHHNDFIGRTWPRQYHWRFSLVLSDRLFDCSEFKGRATEVLLQCLPGQAIVISDNNNNIVSSLPSRLGNHSIRQVTAWS
jgi:hypothetical protein